MYKMLLVGIYTGIMKEMYDYLTGPENDMPLQVQLCAGTRSTFNTTAKIVEPDVIFVNVTGLDIHEHLIFEDIKSNYKYTKLICIGTDKELKNVSMRIGREEYIPLVRPKSNHEILLAVQGAFNWIPVVEEVKPVLLFVDDDPVILRTMRKAFKEKYEVLMATSGEEALFQLESRSPDIIFLDYEMPGITGGEVMEQLKSNPQYEDIPVVFLTSLNEKEKIISLLNLKPEGYLLKPVQLDEIESKIVEIFDKKLKKK